MFLLLFYSAPFCPRPGSPIPAISVSSLLWYHNIDLHFIFVHSIIFLSVINSEFRACLVPAPFSETHQLLSPIVLPGRLDLPVAPLPTNPNYPSSQLISLSETNHSTYYRSRQANVIQTGYDLVLPHWWHCSINSSHLLRPHRWGQKKQIIQQ